MIPVNRDTVLTVATIVCALGIIFLFREMNKTKEEMNSFKGFSAQVIKHLSAPPVMVPEPKLESVAEEKKEE
jgi:hypothetical protein